MKHDPGLIPWVLSGPIFLLVTMAALAIATLTAVLVGRTARLIELAEFGRERLARGRAIPVLWGLSAAFVLLIAAGALVNSKVLALLGIAIFLFAVLVIGLGTGVAALDLGRELTDTFGSVDADDLTKLRVGMSVLFTASLIPLVGWAVTLLIIGGGVGAVMELLVTNRGD